MTHAARGFPVWIRATHRINVLFIGFLIRTSRARVPSSSSPASIRHWRCRVSVLPLWDVGVLTPVFECIPGTEVL